MRWIVVVALITWVLIFMLITLMSIDINGLDCGGYINYLNCNVCTDYLDERWD